MNSLLISAGPDVKDLLKYAGMLLIIILVIGVFYLIIHQTIVPLPPMLVRALDLLLILAVIVGVIVYFLLPLVQ